VERKGNGSPDSVQKTIEPSLCLRKDKGTLSSIYKGDFKGMNIYHFLPSLIIFAFPFLGGIIKIFNLCIFPIYFGFLNAMNLNADTTFKKILSFVWIFSFLGCAHIIEYIIFISNNSMDSEGILLFCLEYKISVCIFAVVYFLIQGFTKNSFMVVTSLSSLYSCFMILVYFFRENQFVRFFEPFFWLNDESQTFLVISIFTIIWCVFVKTQRNYAFKICILINLLNVMLWSIHLA